MSQNKSKKTFSLPLKIGSLVSILALVGIGIFLQQKSNQDDEVSYTHSLPVTDNSSFISPLAEVFGEVSVGKEVFIASNTILRADPGARICIDSETNFQDNILFLALRGHLAPSSTCGALASST